MRKPLLAGNWKMNTTREEAVKLAEDLKKMIKNESGRDVLVCPPFTNIDAVAETLRDSGIMVGAQDLFWEDKGAYTGEISAPMIKVLGATYVIIGHSERRQYFGETDETVNKKLKAALKHSLFPIVCVGETLEQREANKTLKVIETQVNGALMGLNKEQMLNTTIAYEPVWAIGTGKTATPEQAQEVHAYIRELIAVPFGKDVAEKVRILYGGSMNPENVKELMGQPDIDGGLIGGASLKADSFSKIVNFES